LLVATDACMYSMRLAGFDHWHFEQTYQRWAKSGVGVWRFFQSGSGVGVRFCL